jgi:hypothetical protein
MPNFRNSSKDTIDANGESVALAYRQFFNGGVGVQVTGTFSGTLQFEVTIDGTNYVAVPALNVTTGTEATTTTGTGIFRFDVVGILMTRVRATAWTSGSAEVTVVGLAG